jgi:predicted kinase
VFLFLIFALLSKNISYNKIQVMTEDEAKQWVKSKANQARVVELFFENNKPTKSKTAFFMAGIPGAGKTEFAENAIKTDRELIPIEHDQIVEYIDGYRPEQYYKYRKAGSTLVTKVFDECLQNGYSFIFDGTLSHKTGAKDVKRCLKAGYEVFIIYIVKDATLAWELTQARELVKKRSIERAGFIATCRRINANLLNIFETHRENPSFSFWVIDKQGKDNFRGVTAIIHGRELDSTKEIEKALKQNYNI